MTLSHNTYTDELLASMEINFRIEDFDFPLPESYIAREPRSERSAGRLLCVNKTNGDLTHSQFSEFDSFINEGDLLIFNNTRIIPSHLIVTINTGEVIDVFVERILSDTHMLARIFKSSHLNIGDFLTINANDTLEIIDNNGEFFELVLASTTKITLWDLINNHAELAFPLYFQRNATARDKEVFQTIYATKAGSVSAPSAGFHFDEKTFIKLKEKNVAIGYVTLHVGSGTSAPIHVNDISKHKMHTEWLEVSAELCDLIKQTKAKGKRVIAIGTTSLRALETASQDGAVKPYNGYTNIFIRPGHHFNCADGLFTNLHLPRSTLMILISALAGYQHIKHAYKTAIEKEYRFLAYGDGMLIT